MITCPMCEKEGANLLGVLGNLAHFRCVYCGLEFHTDAEFILDLADGADEEQKWREYLKGGRDGSI